MRELGRRMGAREFTKWQAYSQIEPFGERRADARTWALIAHITNCLSGGGEQIDLRRILPDWEGPAEDPLIVAWRIKQQIEAEMELDRRWSGKGS